MFTRTRRRLAAAIIPLAFVACSTAAEPVALPTASTAPPSSAPAEALAEHALAGLEARFDARLGVYAVDTRSGRSIAHRAYERFAYASTVKVLAAAVVLDRTTPAELAQAVPYDSSELVAHSPVTEERLAAGMTLGELAEAALRHSDNTAANLLLDRIGGPQALDAALAAFGDDVTTVVRDEPELNDTAPGDDRDTSTPRALAADLRAFAVGDALAEEDRAQLVDWMTGNATGRALVRAGVPADWHVADKSGTAAYGTRNDIAVVYPPEGEPIVVAVMSDRDLPDDEHDDALVAEPARIVVEALR
ncbi:class A beta-lactamase [Geodermatophilus marinus]|uniref:class A beta-lactamase n=1 Tax=Geodermatophilus sp. LHW52908 TaxID=2303986 RepID=UPI003519D98C